MPTETSLSSSANALICLSHLRWKFVFQRPQHLMTRFARERPVFFFEEPVFDDGPARLVSERCATGVHIVVPHLPHGTTQVETALAELLTELLDDHAISAPVLWYYTPMALGFTSHVTPSAVIYDCMDELSGFLNAPAELIARERQLFELADHVFTGGYSLYEAKRAHHPSVHPFPSSVDRDHFGKARIACDDPSDQASIGHPRMGFFGVIDERMDLELLDGLAARRPDWNIVVLGPVVKIDPASLPRRANIHYLGMKTYAELPQYLAGWDVALMPFALNAATRFISPTKTPEYLAGGKPVVSTAIHDVVRTYGEEELAFIVGNAEEAEAAVERALALDPEAHIAKTDAYLASMSWDVTWSKMRALVGQAVADRRLRAASKRVRPAKPHFDVLVVGAGFAGSVAAERLARALGKTVIMCDVRPHIGGNAFDYIDDAGVRVHKYGPHIFHTNSADVSGYLSQFTAWTPYEHRVRAFVDGKYLPMPINLDTVNALYGWSLTSEQLASYFTSVAELPAEVRTSEDVIVSKVGRELYEKFFRGYTRKQWGLDPSELDASVTARIPVRLDRDDRYFTDSFQNMPKDGYTAMFTRMLDHPNITVEVETDYRDLQQKVSFDEIIYTGPVDAYFDHVYGKLPYRSLRFDLRTYPQSRFQEAPVVNYPNDHAYTRVTEFTQLTGHKLDQTTVVYEHPEAHGDPYYPVPRPENHRLYKAYQELADRTPHVHFVGRLATYKYYNMDQVVAQALSMVCKLSGFDRKGLLAASA